MFPLLSSSWSPTSLIAREKAAAPDVKMFAHPQGPPPPPLPPPRRRSSVAVESALHPLKRKRAAVDDPPAVARRCQTPPHSPPSPPPPPPQKRQQQQQQPPTKPHSPPSSPTTPQPITHPSDPSSVPAAVPLPRKVNVARLRQSLDVQLGLEVLLKHDELRLIDQETAKCQVALEQLRRCSEIPFPALRATPSPDVASGTGFAVLPNGTKNTNNPAPVSPAPWGVVDGPYSRHYARWLLPDPRFDGGPATDGSLLASLPPLDTRTTRASWADGSSLRSQRAAAAAGAPPAKLQALSSGYPVPKDKTGPMIIRRKSDGKLVKLVCLDCHRDNFSSTQGFINHCRIAHNRNFASHDAAASASGVPVEVDDAGAVIGEPETSTATGGTAAAINSAATASAPTSSGHVHPLVRSAHSITQPDGPEEEGGGSPIRRGRTDPEGSSTPARSAPTAASDSPSFKGSQQTPNLTALLKRRGVNVDLMHLVDDSLTRLDPALYADEDDDKDCDNDRDVGAGDCGPVDGDTDANRAAYTAAGHQPHGRARLPAHTTFSPARVPGGSRGRKGKARSQTGGKLGEGRGTVSTTGSPSTSATPPSLASFLPVSDCPTTEDPGHNPSHDSVPAAISTASSASTTTVTARPTAPPTTIDPASADLSPATVVSNQPAPSLVSDDPPSPSLLSSVPSSSSPPVAPTVDVDVDIDVDMDDVVGKDGRRDRHERNGGEVKVQDGEDGKNEAAAPALPPSKKGRATRTRSGTKEAGLSGSVAPAAASAPAPSVSTDSGRIPGRRGRRKKQRTSPQSQLPPQLLSSPSDTNALLQAQLQDQLQAQMLQQPAEPTEPLVSNVQPLLPHRQQQQQQEEEQQQQVQEQRKPAVAIMQPSVQVSIGAGADQE